jgi:hypothetical protein
MTVSTATIRGAKHGISDANMSQCHGFRNFAGGKFNGHLYYQ